MKRLVCRTCTVALLLLFVRGVGAATAPLYKSFDKYPDGASPFITTNTDPYAGSYSFWRIDNPTGTSGVYRNGATGHLTACSAALPVTNLAHLPFRVSTNFTVQSFIAGMFSGQGNVGVAAFSYGPDFSNDGYRLAYQVFGPGTGSAPPNGSLTLYRGGQPVATSQYSGHVPVVVGASYTMTLAGAPSAAGLRLTGTVRQGSDMISVVYTDPRALAGTYFGYHTEAGHSQNLSSIAIGFDNFAVTSPQPTAVTNTNASGAGSLQQAILHANATPGADTILFQIPGSGLHKSTSARPTTGLSGHGHD